MKEERKQSRKERRNLASEKKKEKETYNARKELDKSTIHDIIRYTINTSTIQGIYEINSRNNSRYLKTTQQ